jgi:oxygen-independent coproporphyrinogen-3 oxidase
MLNALRLTEGFSETQLRERTGLPTQFTADRLAGAQHDGLLARDERGTWKPTELGLRFLNDLQARFLPGG